MLVEELIALVDHVQKFKCETRCIEVKTSSKGCPTHLYETLSAFSNQDDGGIILFGLDESNNFELAGVYDIQDLQHNVLEQCKQMEPVVRPLFTFCELEGKKIVSAEIPGIDVSQRPVYYKGKGRLKGSYLRSGASNESMSEYEIYAYDAYRQNIHDDLRIVADADFNSLDNEKLRTFLEKVRSQTVNLKVLEDKEILELQGVTKKDSVTLAGLLMFAKYPQMYFPQLCVTAVVIPGLEMGCVGKDGERFLANQRILGTIPEMVEETVRFVDRNVRVKTIVDDGKRADKTEFPITAVREAVLNALMHRDYSAHSERVPVRIEMYADRMEIKNNGGLYGKISLDELGRVRPDTRNQTLVNLLEIMGETENRYSGIPTMRRELKEYNLPEPEFNSKGGMFVVTFRNDMQRNVSDSTIPVIETDTIAKILDYCRTPRSREELAEFLEITKPYLRRSIIIPLIDRGLLAMTIPDKPKSTHQKYYAVK